ncbi:uncharacterized protein LOC133895973 [Phragmites australis]|uniref:uncharacterized protein LOC133895973 n=1 Tax=Phragmites australis TaxID=29695 RepID=UPI002D77BACF|nr:uncharacterized protein LOC133895973 [Phragmites australis]
MLGSTEDWATRWTSPALEELLPDLSREEQLRLQNGSRDRKGKLKRHAKMETVSPSPPIPLRTEEVRDAFVIPTVRDALRHYNARHPGGEFDCVKPLMQARVGFRGQVWFHVNFWARSRSSNKIKRFFAEVHYKPSTRSSSSSSSVCLDPKPIPIVEICTIIEEPLCQYRRSCAFCPGDFDILHPKGCRKFVCGNDKDRIEQRLTPCMAADVMGILLIISGLTAAHNFVLFLSSLFFITV